MKVVLQNLETILFARSQIFSWTLNFKKMNARVCILMRMKLMALFFRGVRVNLCQFERFRTIKTNHFISFVMTTSSIHNHFLLLINPKLFPIAWKFWKILYCLEIYSKLQVTSGSLRGQGSHLLTIFHGLASFRLNPWYCRTRWTWWTCNGSCG